MPKTPWYSAALALTLASVPCLGTAADDEPDAATTCQRQAQEEKIPAADLDAYLRDCMSARADEEEQNTAPNPRPQDNGY